MKKPIIIVLLLIAAVSLYFMLSDKNNEAQERENLGTLEETTYDSDKRYCRYKLTSAIPDAGYVNVGDIFCIECDVWPGGDEFNPICPVRIAYKSNSGLVKYKAELEDPKVRPCAECINGTRYFKNP